MPDKKEKPTPEQIKPNNPLEDESKETPTFAEHKQRITSDDNTEFDTTTVGDAVTTEVIEGEKGEKEEPTPEEPKEEKAEEPPKEVEEPKETVPEAPPEVSPPAPTVPSLTEELPDNLKEEEKTFNETLKNPQWRPTTWLELHEEQERYKTFLNSVDEHRSQQELTTINKVWDEQLATMKQKGNAYGVELPTDTDKKIEREIFAIMTEFGDKDRGTVMPLPQAAKLWQERQSRKAQPPGGNAPISTGQTESPKVIGKKYSEIKGKSVDELIELGLKGQES